MSAKEMLAEIKQRGLIKAGNIQDELNALAVSQEEEIISLNQQLSAKTISEQNIINAFGIKGEGTHSKLVIEYVHGLVAENARMREAIAFATAPDMWQEQHDGMLDYRYVDWYVDVLNAALEPKSADAAIAEIKAQGVDEFARTFNPETIEGSSMVMVAKTFAANLRAGRKCNIPPAGWSCTRAAGHDGPCAAVEDASHE